jgi:uncharacterized membrane protein
MPFSRGFQKKAKEVAMKIIGYGLLWVLSFAFTSAIDTVWHLVIFRKAYIDGIKPLARMSGNKMAFNALAGILSQVMVVTCIVVLVSYKALQGGFGAGFLIGALAGVLAISVYGITNYALFKDWGLRITILEMIWGPILGGFSGLFVTWMRSLLIK